MFRLREPALQRFFIAQPYRLKAFSVLFCMLVFKKSLEEFRCLLGDTKV